MPATMPIARSKASPAKVEVEKGSPPGIETTRRARISGLGQPQYLGTTLDVQRIQNGLRAAERGDTWLLFTYFRDMAASYSHLTGEWIKRKCVITGNPQTLIPNDPENPDDVEACGVIDQMIKNCPGWNDGLNHLLDATLWPLAVAEKIAEPVDMATIKSGKLKYPVRYLIKALAPVDPVLFNFKLPYIPGYTSSGDKNAKFDPDDWESWLAFYGTNSQGMPEYSMKDTYRPTKDIHIVHRANMMSPTIPPNFGGLMRQILFLWLLSTQDRDWWAQFMQKYGKPILVGKVNVQQIDTVAYMQQAFALCTELGGLVIDSKAEIEALAVNCQDGANAHKIFQEWCDCKVSLLVIGQSLSATPKNTGMGSGASGQAEEVREDIRKSDTAKLSDTLRTQLFQPYLENNGYRGAAPRVIWGGMRSGESSGYSKTLAQMRSAGYKLSERGLRAANENLGIEFENDALFNKPAGIASTVNAQEGDNDSRTKY